MPPRTRAQVAAAKKKAHAAAILKKYGMTGDEYWALYEFQGKRCAICRVGRGVSRRLAVDHDHNYGCSHDPKSGCAECDRGLLCGYCNVLLGRAKDDPEFFLRAVRYLESPPWRRMRELEAAA